MNNKDYTRIKRLYEAEMPFNKVLKDPSVLCIEQHMIGKHVACQWTHYIRDADGFSKPAFLEINHRGVPRPQYTLGLKNAQKWIAHCDKWIDAHPEDYPDRVGKDNRKP